MSADSVRRFFQDKGQVNDIIEFEESTATVQLAANALGVEPELIAKTMALKLKDRNILLVTKGDARIDNRRYKDYFKTKAKMLNSEEVSAVTGHPIGGVCPFGLNEPLDIYLDLSLKQFEYVYPAAGSKNSAVKVSINQLEELTGGSWVDVCK